MREIRQSGSEGGEPQPNAASLPLSEEVATIARLLAKKNDLENRRHFRDKSAQEFQPPTWQLPDLDKLPPVAWFQGWWSCRTDGRDAPPKTAEKVCRPGQRPLHPRLPTQVGRQTMGLRLLKSLVKPPHRPRWH